MIVIQIRMTSWSIDEFIGLYFYILDCILFIFFLYRLCIVIYFQTGFQIMSLT